MTETTTIELAALLSPERLERLQEEARQQNRQLPALVQDVIERYLEELDEDEWDQRWEERENALRDCNRSYGSLL